MLRESKEDDALEQELMSTAKHVNPACICICVLFAQRPDLQSRRLATHRSSSVGHRSRPVADYAPV